jgi:hypothetical protein
MWSRRVDVLLAVVKVVSVCSMSCQFRKLHPIRSYTIRSLREKLRSSGTAFPRKRGGTWLMTLLLTTSSRFGNNSSATPALFGHDQRKMFTSSSVADKR